MTATPRLDAVRLWLASGQKGDIPWPAEIGQVWPDPPEWANADVRLEAALMACASGARAQLPLPPPKPLPPPPRTPT